MRTPTRSIFKLKSVTDQTFFFETKINYLTLISFQFYSPNEKSKNGNFKIMCRSEIEKPENVDHSGGSRAFVRTKKGGGGT